MLRTLVVVVCCATLALITSPTSARAQGTTVIVDVDPNLTLRCNDRINFNANSALLSAIFAGGGNGDVANPTSSATTSTNASLGTIDFNVSNLDSSLTADPTAIIGTAAQICEMEGNVPSGTYQVSTTLLNNDLLGANGVSRIVTTAATARVSQVGGGFSNSFTFPGFFFNFVNPLNLDFQFTFDLSDVGQSGLHSSPVDGVFRVTVVRL